jgi:hypothetical protein
MNSKRKILSLALTAIAMAAGVIISSCKSKSDDSSTSSYSYSGPGSNYTVSSSDGTYSFKKYTNAGSSTPDFTVTATATDINGFKKFSLTDVTGSGGPTVGSTVYGFEVPGMALFVKPLDQSNPDQVLVAVASGACPSTTFNANWIKVKVHSGVDISQANNDTFGTFTYTVASGDVGTASLPSKFSLANPTTNCASGACNGSGFSAASCSGGIMRLTNGGDYITIYLTAIGAAIVNTSDVSANSDFIFGMPQPSGSFTTTAFAGTYSGMYYIDSAASGQKLKAIKATLTAGSSTTLSGSGSELSSVDNDTTTGSAATLSLTANASYPGILTGTLTTTGTANLACVAVANANGSGKNVLDCAGIDPGSSTGLFNFLLVSR